MWSSKEKVFAEIMTYFQDDCRGLYGSFVDDELVGLIGIVHMSDGEVELKHIAIRQDYRGKGIGSSMLYEYCESNHIVTMTAETDKDAVGFYIKLGFSIISLGENYPGIERFKCQKSFVED